MFNLMDELVFNTQLDLAFDDAHLPIADKINELKHQLSDDLIGEIIHDFLLMFKDNAVEIDINNFYETHINKSPNFHYLCQLHDKVIKSQKYDISKVNPVKNTQLWYDSVTWLTIHIYVMKSIRQTQHHEVFERFANSDIFWYFKWVVSGAVDNPDCALQTIDEYNQIFKHVLDDFDLGSRSYHKTLVMQGIKLANPVMIKEHLMLWQEAMDSWFDDCWACQVDDVVRAYCFLGQYDKALSWAKEIIDGSVSCGTVPHVTNSLIAQAYFYTNQHQKALDTLKAGYPLIFGNLSYVRPISEFMHLYRQMGMPDKAVRIYQEHHQLIQTCQSPFERMLFYIETAKLNIPEQDKYSTMAHQLAQSFDKRNGNEYYSSQLTKRA